MRVHLLLSLLLLSPEVGRAESLSRSQAVALALAANPEVRRGREDLEILEGRGREALADALPEVKLLGSAARYRDPALLNSSSFDAFPEELRRSLTPVPANIFEGVLTVRQTLFSFKLGRAVTAARYGLRMGREAIRRAENVVALDTVRAYNAYLLSLAKVDVAEKSVRLKETHLQMAQNRRAAGVATELDVLRAQVDLENQRSQLERMRWEVNSARGALNVLMVRPVDAPIEPTDTLAFEELRLEVADVVRRALAQRPEVKGVELNDKFREQLVGAAQAESRPSVDFNATWGYSVRNPDNFLESNFQKWNAGVVLTVPLFDGFRTAGRVAQARAERDKVLQDRVALESSIRLDAQDAVEQLQVAARVLSAAELNVRQAERALQMTQANYNQGAATTLDVMDAQAALTLAESLKIQALHDHANARATVRFVMGEDPLGPEEPGDRSQNEEDSSR